MAVAAGPGGPSLLSTCSHLESLVGLCHAACHSCSLPGKGGRRLWALPVWTEMGEAVRMDACSLH